MASRLQVLGTVLLAPLCAVLTLRFGPDPVRCEDHAPLIWREQDFIGSAQCRGCHPDQHASWARTFHRTMTQRVNGATVKGAFDGNQVEFYGQKATPLVEGGKWFMRLPANGATRTAEVALAVGSRRYQQYFERVPRGLGFAFQRLPLVWHIGAQRWMHMNGVFLEPDDDDWNRHASTWNKNCIFCHNTGVAPRWQNFREHPNEANERYDSVVGELGIACEACHGPGREHAASQRAPLRRYAAHFAGGHDATIVNPKSVKKQISVDLCGQCHGQRMPKPTERIEAWMQTGPTFRAGNLLADHVTPIAIVTPSPKPDAPDLFQQRFYKDGTARLTAYEYQGITSSQCFLKGELTCLSCHAMHNGDPNGQLAERARGNLACTQCHAQIARDLPAHTHHASESSGSSCVECHMPKIVFGILDVHRSHRIDNPDPKRDAEAGRPGACTLCHLDQTPIWAAESIAKLWGKPVRTPSSRLDAASLTFSDASACLLAGDAVQRAVATKAMGRKDSALLPRDKAALRVHLTTTLCDAYPSIRWLACTSLRSLENELPLGLAQELEAFDTTRPMDERRTRAFALFEALARGAPGKLEPPRAGSLVLPDFKPDLPAITNLLNLQSHRVISIGE